MKNSVDEITVLDSLIDDYNISKLLNIDNIWSQSKGEGVKIVTIDTGADVNHVEIKDSIKSVFNMIDKSYDVADDVGHGTHIAGLLVGKNTGVAPLADLHVIKVLDENGSGSMADVLDGITHSINLKADVLCISLGIKNDMPMILKQRIIQAYEAGIAIVCSTGNDSSAYARYPSAMDEVIAVGGLDKDGKLAKFSNGGYDVLAPSVDILSAYKDGKYAKMTGTSMSAPLVAGVIALLISAYRKYDKELSVKDIKELVGNSLLNYIDNNKK